MNMQNDHLTRWLTGRQRRRLAAVALLGALALGLVACGDDGGGDQHDASPRDAQQADAPAAIDAATADAGGIDAAPVDAGAGFDYEIYLRGSFNDFDDSAPFTDNGDNTYTATIELTAATHEFKIADVDFTDGRTWSLDADSEIEVALDTPTTLVLAMGFDNNTILTIAAGDEGEYRFVVDATNSAAPTLTVTQIVIGP